MDTEEKNRLGTTEAESFDPKIENTPDLPVIDFSAVGQQEPALLDTPSDVQGNWGSAIYDSYGFYTSYNGALTA